MHWGMPIIPLPVRALSPTARSGSVVVAKLPDGCYEIYQDREYVETSGTVLG